MKILLNLYDRIVTNHALQKTKLIENLASDYYLTYVKLFSNIPMLSGYSIEVYGTVNLLRSHRTPKFIHYEEFRRSFS